MIISILLVTGLSFAAPKLNDREINLKYLKQVYGENYQNLKDLRFWYGYYHKVSVLTLPPGVSRHSPQFHKFRKDKEASYLPSENDVKKVCGMRHTKSEGSQDHKRCELHLKSRKSFFPIYEKPDSISQPIGFFDKNSGAMYYRGNYLELHPPQNPEDFEGNVGELSWRPFLAPVLDYKIIVQDGAEREWMRLPTMGLPGEAWVGTTDIEGPLPILDRQRSNKLTKGNQINGLGLAQLSKSRLLKNSCYLGIEKGKVLFKQFIFPMNWDNSLRSGNSADEYFLLMNEDVSQIGVKTGEMDDPIVKDYLKRYKEYPPLVFRLPLIDFFMGLANQFRDEVQVALSPGEVDRNCDYPSEFFYKKIPKSGMLNFAETYGNITREGPTGKSRFVPMTFTGEMSKTLKDSLRGEAINDPFSIYIHQIQTGE